MSEHNSVPTVVYGPGRTTAALSPEVARLVAEAMQQPARPEPPLRPPRADDAWPRPLGVWDDVCLYASRNFNDLMFWLFYKFAAIQLYTDYFLFADQADNHFLYGPDQTRWPAPMTVKQARDKAIACLRIDHPDWFTTP